MTTTATEWARGLARPVDGAGLAAFRVGFGALMVASTLRFALKGWVDELYLAPGFHFTYLGFEWVRPWPGVGMYVHLAAMGVLALLVMLGLRTRAAALGFFALFTYAELIDQTVYLNHYYFVSLAALLLAVVPAGATGSLDARREGERAVPAWAYTLLRAQVGLVYFYAGLAKVNPDWLLRAEPLATWLPAYAHVPVVGPLLAERATAFAMSWAGAAFDLSIAALLAWPRTRRWAYAAALGFHATVGLLFPIGVFSWVMALAGTVFFDPGWPRRFVGGAAPTPAAPRPLPRWALALGAAYLAVQVALPLRHTLYPGWVNWTEEGFRFAWRVMLIEKTGQVELDVRADDQTFRVFPRAELTPLQYKMMSTQPDMIQQYAHHVAARYRAAGHRRVAVFAHAFAALNGRPSQRLVDPTVDLAAEPRGLGPKRWIVPLAVQPGAALGSASE